MKVEREIDVEVRSVWREASGSGACGEWQTQEAPKVDAFSPKTDMGAKKC